MAAPPEGPFGSAFQNRRQDKRKNAPKRAPADVGLISTDLLLSVQWPEQNMSTPEKMQWLREEAIKKALGEE